MMVNNFSERLNIGRETTVDPLITIGLPVYNGERYLVAVVSSLLRQDFEDFLLVISDNASTDSTQSICERIAAEDSRVRYVRHSENKGAMFNYNYVFELAETKYFKWAAYDDICLPGMLSRCVDTLESAPVEVGVVYPRAEIINDEGNVVATVRDKLNLVSKNPARRFGQALFQMSLASAFYGVFRTEELRKCRPFGNIAADHVILAELALFSKILEIPETLFQLRLHSSNAMAANPSRKSMRMWHAPQSRGSISDFLPYSLVVISEHFRSICRTHLKFHTRMACCGALLTVPPWRWFLRVSGPWRNRIKNLITTRRARGSTH